MKGWVLAMHCHNANMAQVIQGAVEAEDIPVVLMNKQDSSYVGMCFATRPVEIWVPESHEEQAKTCLQALQT